jgi:hypothetical protein
MTFLAPLIEGIIAMEKIELCNSAIFKYTVRRQLKITLVHVSLHCFLVCLKSPFSSTPINLYSSSTLSAYCL